MVKQGSGWPPSCTSQPQPIEWEETTDLVANNDGNESVDSLEACLRTSNSPSDDRDTFEKMEQALRDAEEVVFQINNIDRRSPSNGSIQSDVGNFMDLRSNPNPVSKYSAGGKEQTEDVIDRLAMAKTYPLSTGTETEDDTLELTTVGSGTYFSYNDPVKRYVPDGKQEQSKDEISRALFGENVTVDSSTQDESLTRSDEDYVANMVADVKRRRSKKEVQQTYWQKYDLEDREVDGERSGTLYIDDDEMDNSTLTGTFYSEDEDGTLDDSWMCGLREKQRHSSRENLKENVLGLLENACTGDLCLGAVEDEIPNQITKKQWVQRKKNRRKSSRRGEARDAQEDATLEGGTVLSGYTREDATLADTLLSGSTRGGTLMSGSYTAEYEIPVPVHSPISEPNFLAEDDGAEEENELVSDKAFAVIQNVCSGSWLRGGGDGKGYQLFNKQSFQSKGEGATVKKRNTNAKESEVAAFTVKERLHRTKSMQSVKQGSEEIVAKDVKEREDLNRNKSMVSSTFIRTPSQDELKAIYESISSKEGKKSSLVTNAKSFSKTASSFRKQSTSKLAALSTEAKSHEIQAFTVTVTFSDPKQGASTEKINHDADTVEASNQRQRDALSMLGCESDEPTKDSPAVITERKKSFRPKLFSFKSKKGPKRTAPSIDASSPARTAATGTSTSDSSIESRSHNDEESASDAALTVIRTDSRVLISI